MLEITFLNNSKQEQTITYTSYDEFQRAQYSCTPPTADFHKVVKLSYNGHLFDYNDTFGNIFFFLEKQDLSQFD